MTLGDMIARAKTNIYEGADPVEIAGWLYRLDSRLWREYIQPREGGNDIEKPKEYSQDAPDQVLLLDVPDDELYDSYLEYCLYRRLGEDARADDAAAVFNRQLQQWGNNWVQGHRISVPVRFTYH